MDKKKRITDSTSRTTSNRPRSSRDSVRKSTSVSRTPSNHKANVRKSRSTVSTPPMDKVSMLVMEANEITQILKKDYEFSKVDDSCKDEGGTDIRVTNTQLKISCFWRVSKLKERLQRMRKLMYQPEPGVITDEVFYDPNDTWTRADSCKDIISEDKSSSDKSIDSVSDKTQMDKVKISSTQSKSSQSEAKTAMESPAKSTQLTIEQQKSKLGLISKPDSLELSSSVQEIPVKDVSPVKPVVPSTGSMELPADSQFIITSVGTPSSPDTASLLSTPSKVNSTTSHHESYLSSNKEPFLPEKYIRGNHSPPERDVTISATSTPRSGRVSPPLKNRNIFPAGLPQMSPPKLSLKPAGPLKPKLTAPWNVTRKAIKMTFNRAKVWKNSISLVDEVLRDCEALKLTIVGILERYSDHVLRNSQDQSELEQSHMTCIQLVRSCELLNSHLGLWSSSLCDAIDSPIITQLTESLHKTVLQITEELNVFLQACEDKNESSVQDSATKVLDYVYDLGKYCGELAITADTSLTSLRDTDPAINIDDLMKVSDDDIVTLYHRPGSDLKQACLTGADIYVDKTLDSALKGVKQCELGLQNVSLDVERDSKSLSDLMRQADMLVATTKILILRCQEVETEMDVTMKDVEGEKPTNYFHNFYLRCQGVINHVGALADSITYLERAFKPLTQTVTDAALHQVCRCSDMVRKAACKLAGLPADLTLSGSTTELKLIMQGMSVLSEAQRSQLESAAQDVKLSTDRLNEQAKKCTGVGSGKAHRMLPVTPGASVVKRVSRSHSARGHPNRRSMPAFPLDNGILTAR